MLSFSEIHLGQISRVGLSEQISKLSMTSNTNGLWQRDYVSVGVLICDWAVVTVGDFSVASSELSCLNVGLTTSHLIMHMYSV